MKYTIDQELANDILAYLQKCPYIEVVDLIEGLRKLTPIQEQPK